MQRYAVVLSVFILMFIGFYTPAGAADDYAAIDKREKEYTARGLTASDLEPIRQQAEKGNAQAQYWMGYFTANGIGMAQNQELSMIWYRKAADQHYAPAECKIGYHYQMGWGVPRDLDESLKWQLKAANAGYPLAQYDLGIIYLYGIGTPVQPNEAIRWLELAANNHVAAAMFDLSQVYCNCTTTAIPRDDAKSAYWSERAADAGNLTAMYNLGVVYNHGRGVPKDSVKAAQWYRKAAEQDYTLAQFNLGCMYRDGRGIPKDYAQALYWFHKAADKGFMRARASIAAFYDEGWGVPKDLKQSFYWHRLAAEQGSPEEEFNTGNAYFFARGVPKDVDLARQWWMRAALQGDAMAINDIGVGYFEGIAAKQDYVQAYAWLNASLERGYEHPRDKRDRSAAKLTPEELEKAKALSRRITEMTSQDGGNRQEEELAGNAAGKAHPLRPGNELSDAEKDAVAQFRFGNAYHERKNEAEAVKWWHRAADQNILAAQYALGRAYENGEGVPQDSAQAASWYRRAGEQYYGDAQKKLGHLYEEGKGVPKDFVSAYFWYTLSTQQYGGDAVYSRDALAKRMTPEQIKQGDIRVNFFLHPLPKSLIGPMFAAFIMGIMGILLITGAVVLGKKKKAA